MCTIMAMLGQGGLGLGGVKMRVGCKRLQTNLVEVQAAALASGPS